MKRNQEPTVVIAGSRALPHGAAPRILVRFLASLPERSRVLLRRGLFSPPGLFEAQVESLCDLLGLRVQWCFPDPGGREQTYRRDLTMIDRADIVLCFYTIDQIGDETSGTVALAEKALEAERIVYAYALDGKRMRRVGEHDPGNTWAELVPAPS